MRTRTGLDTVGDSTWAELFARLRLTGFRDDPAPQDLDTIEWALDLAADGVYGIGPVPSARFWRLDGRTPRVGTNPGATTLAWEKIGVGPSFTVTTISDPSVKPTFLAAGEQVQVTVSGMVASDVLRFVTILTEGAQP